MRERDKPGRFLHSVDIDGRGRQFIQSVLLDSIEGAILRSSLARASKACAIAEAIRYSRGYHWVGLYDVSSTYIIAVGWSGPIPPARPIVSRSRGLRGNAVKSGQSQVIQDVAQHPGVATTRISSRAKALFPVSVEGVVAGILDVENDRVNSFTVLDEEFLAGAAQMLRPFWRGLGSSEG